VSEKKAGENDESKSATVQTLAPIRIQPIARAPQPEPDRRLTSSWHEPSVAALVVSVGATLVFFAIALFSFDWAAAAQYSALLAAGLGVICVVIGLLKVLTAEGRKGWFVWVVVGGLFFVLGYFELPAAVVPLHYAQAAMDESSGRYDLAYNELRLAGVGACEPRATRDVLRWGDTDRAAGHFGLAVKHYALLIQNCPDTHDAHIANAEIAQTRLEWGEQLVSTGDYAGAVDVFEDIQHLYPASPTALAARQAEAGALIDWGDRDEREGRYADALAHYQRVLATYPETAYATTARDGAAQTLYDWGQWATRYAHYDEAVAHYNVLVDTYPGTPQADQAATLLRASQTVVGRLVHRDGSAAVGVQVRLSSEYQFGGGNYSVGGTQLAAVTDATGIFHLDAVPPGTYLLEWTDQWGHYTTFVDATGNPIDVLTVPQLHPLSAGDVVIDPVS
jgi:tetratricopeptide (TPR) repeat protein